MVQSVSIGNRRIGRGNSCFIVAELGTAHGGNLETAFRLVEEAANAGADAVKLQIVIADEILHPLTGSVSLPGGRIPLYNKFKELERDISFYKEIKTRAEEKGLVFLCTPFGIMSARSLNSLDCDLYKIASPELNHVPLLREVRSYGKPVFLSSGVSTLGDIEKALDFCGSNVVLFHCVTAYPAPEEEYNLRLIPVLGDVFGVEVGVSDHSRDPVLIPALSTSLGSCALEKHFTLSTGGGGLDDPIALEPGDFEMMVGAVRKSEKLGEDDVRAWLEREYGSDRISSIVGTGRKELAPSELKAYGRTNRSIHALGNIEKGDVLSEENMSILRSEQNLSPGLEPEYYDLITGKRTVRHISDGEGIGWKHLLIPK